MVTKDIVTMFGELAVEYTIDGPNLSCQIVELGSSYLFRISSMNESFRCHGSTKRFKPDGFVPVYSCDCIALDESHIFLRGSSRSSDFAIRSYRLDSFRNMPDIITSLDNFAMNYIATEEDIGNVNKEGW